MIAFSRTFRRLAFMIWSPVRAFEEIRERPTWLGAFLIVSLGSAAIAWMTLPVFQKISLLSLTDSLSSDQLKQITQMHQTMRYVYTGGAFLGTFVFSLVTAFLIWLLVQVFEGRGGFKAIFSVVSHSSVVSLISGILVVALVLLKAQIRWDRSAGNGDQSGGGPVRRRYRSPLFEGAVGKSESVQPLVLRSSDGRYCNGL